MNISSTNSTSYSFGAKIIKNDTYKALIKTWQKRFPAESITKSLRKIQSVEPKSLKIDFTNIDLVGNLHFSLLQEYKEPLKYTIPLKSRNGQSINSEIYSPSNIAKKLIFIIKHYKKRMKKVHIDIFQDLIEATIRKNQYLRIIPKTSQ